MHAVVHLPSDVSAPPASDVVAVKQMPRARPLVTKIISAATKRSYTIVSGDTLSGIAGRSCGDSGKWPGIYGQNRGEIANPDMIYPGQKLTFTCDGPAVVLTSAVPASNSEPGSGKVWGVTYGYPNTRGDGDGDGWDVSGDAPVQQQEAPAPQQEAASAPAAGGTYQGSGAMQQCIISRESGGNSQVMNSTGHYGLYQFSASTWVAHGGNPADFGHASVAEQNQVYANTVAADGYSDWAPYDGC